MTFHFEKAEPLVVAGVNWPVLEYLIDRFNRTSLEGRIVLRRTPLLKELQLCLTAECNGQTLALSSETFEDVLLTSSQEREQLIRVVSRFLLKAKHQHALLFVPPAVALSNSLFHVIGQGASSSKSLREVPDGANITNGETCDGSAE